MNAPSTAHDVLVAAKALIADEANWTQGTFARTAEGVGVPTTYLSACKFCALGAAIRASGIYFGRRDSPLQLAAKALNDAAAKLGVRSGVGSLNDSCDHATVMRAYDLAIEATKGTV